MPNFKYCVSPAGIFELMCLDSVKGTPCVMYIIFWYIFVCSGTELLLRVGLIAVAPVQSGHERGHTHQYIFVNLGANGPRREGRRTHAFYLISPAENKKGEGKGTFWTLIMLSFGAVNESVMTQKERNCAVRPQ